MIPAGIIRVVDAVSPMRTDFYGYFFLAHTYVHLVIIVTAEERSIGDGGRRPGEEWYEE